MMDVEKRSGFEQANEPVPGQTPDVLQGDTGRRQEALSEEVRERINDIVEIFEDALSVAVSRTANKREIMDAAKDLVANLATNAYFESGSLRPLPESYERDLTAALVGAAMVIDPRARIEYLPRVVPIERFSHVRHFLDLVEQRVGRIDPANPSEALLRLRLSDRDQERMSRYRLKK